MEVTGRYGLRAEVRDPDDSKRGIRPPHVQSRLASYLESLERPIRPASPAPRRRWPAMAIVSAATLALVFLFNEPARAHHERSGEYRYGYVSNERLDQGEIRSTGLISDLTGGHHRMLDFYGKYYTKCAGVSYSPSGWTVLRMCTTYNPGPEFRHAAWRASARCWHNGPNINDVSQYPHESYCDAMYEASK